MHGNTRDFSDPLCWKLLFCALVRLILEYEFIFGNNVTMLQFHVIFINLR